MFHKSNKMDNNNSASKLTDALYGFVFGILILLLVFFGALLLNNIKGRFFFSGDVSLDSPDVIKTAGTKAIEGSTYSTSIVYDNSYKNVNVKSRADANKLIEEDSVSQKASCSSEIIDVENYMIENYKITAVNLCELDPNFAKELGNVYKTIYDEYPSVRGYLTNLTLVNTKVSDNYIAAFMPVFTFATSNTQSTYPWVIKTQLLLNTSFFLNQDRLMQTVSVSSTTGHFPRNATMYSPVAHELGHYLSFIALLKEYKLDSILLLDSSNISKFYDAYDDYNNNLYSKKLIKKAYDRYIKDTSTDISFDDFRGSISNYSLSKDNDGNYIYDETIAEAFHDVYLNKTDAEDASIYIVNVLKEELSK